MTVLRGIAVFILFVSIMMNAYTMTRIRDEKPSSKWRMISGITLAVGVVVFAISYFFNI